MTRTRPSVRKILLRGVLVLAVVVVVLNWTCGRLPVTPSPAGRFLQLAGVKLRYLERPGVEPAVLLIHGLPGTAEDFEDVTPFIAVTERSRSTGPGSVSPPAVTTPFDRQLQAVHEVIEKLHLGRPILVGHSYGGTISLAYAERHPAAVRGFVLVDAAAGDCSRHDNAFTRAQARFVQAIELPVIAPISDVTFSQLVRTVSAEPDEKEAFARAGQPAPSSSCARDHAQARQPRGLCRRDPPRRQRNRRRQSRALGPSGSHGRDPRRPGQARQAAMWAQYRRQRPRRPTADGARRPHGAVHASHRCCRRRSALAR